MRPIRPIVLVMLAMSLAAPAQEHVHGDRAEAAPAPRMEADASVRGLDTVLRDERSVLKRLRASVRGRERDRLDESIEKYVAVQAELRGVFRARDGHDEEAYEDAARVAGVCRESLAVLRGMADGAPPALGERVDAAIAAAERTLGAVAELSAEAPAPEAQPRRGGCGMGGSGHRGHAN